MSCGASWHTTKCHLGQVSIGKVGIGPIDLGQIVLTPNLHKHVNETCFVVGE